jgi:protein SCO1/2
MRSRFLLAAGLLASLAITPAPIRAHDHAHHDAQLEAAKPLSGSSIYNLDSPWTTQDGENLTVGTLRGKPAIVAMAYTTCKDMCPAIVADMLWIEKHLPPESASVRLALFSFGSVLDTPARLKVYAADHGLEPVRWTLFHGDEDAVRELAAALGIRYRPDGKGGFDHATVITLLDAGGNIVFQQKGTQANPEELLAKLESLLTTRY